MRTQGTLAPLATLAAALLMDVVSAQSLTQEKHDSQAPIGDRVVAIDVLLEPDAKMVEKAQSANAALRKNYPRGYALDSAHRAHITLVQRYVREKDLPAVETAVAKVLSDVNPMAWALSARRYQHTLWAGVAITAIEVERTPELRRLQEEIVSAVEPFAVAKGTAAAFSTSRELPKIDKEIVTYVEKFVPNSSGDKYNPHVTVGVAHEDFVKEFEGKAFQKFSFKVQGVAIYQLGNFGTAQKKLWQWKARQR